MYLLNGLKISSGPPKPEPTESSEQRFERYRTLPTAVNHKIDRSQLTPAQKNALAEQLLFLKSSGQTVYTDKSYLVLKDGPHEYLLNKNHPVGILLFRAMVGLQKTHLKVTGNELLANLETMLARRDKKILESLDEWITKFSQKIDPQDPEFKSTLKLMDRLYTALLEESPVGDLETRRLKVVQKLTEIKNNKADFVIKGAQKALLTTFLTDKAHAKGLEGVFLKYISAEQDKQIQYAFDDDRRAFIREAYETRNQSAEWNDAKKNEIEKLFALYFPEAKNFSLVEKISKLFERVQFFFNLGRPEDVVWYLVTEKGIPEDIKKEVTQIDEALKLMIKSNQKIHFVQPNESKMTTKEYDLEPVLSRTQKLNEKEAFQKYPHDFSLVRNIFFPPSQDEQREYRQVHFSQIIKLSQSQSVDWKKNYNQPLQSQDSDSYRLLYRQSAESFQFALLKGRQSLTEVFGEEDRLKLNKQRVGLVKDKVSDEVLLSKVNESLDYLGADPKADLVAKLFWYMREIKGMNDDAISNSRLKSQTLEVPQSYFKKLEQSKLSKGSKIEFIEQVVRPFYIEMPQDLSCEEMMGLAEKYLMKNEKNKIALEVFQNAGELSRKYRSYLGQVLKIKQENLSAVEQKKQLNELIANEVQTIDQMIDFFFPSLQINSLSAEQKIRLMLTLVDDQIVNRLQKISRTYIPENIRKYPSFPALMAAAYLLSDQDENKTLELLKNLNFLDEKSSLQTSIAIPSSASGPRIEFYMLDPKEFGLNQNLHEFFVEIVNKAQSRMVNQISLENFFQDTKYFQALSSETNLDPLKILPLYVARLKTLPADLSRNDGLKQFADGGFPSEETLKQLVAVLDDQYFDKGILKKLLNEIKDSDDLKKQMQFVTKRSAWKFLGEGGLKIGFNTQAKVWDQRYFVLSLKDQQISDSDKKVGVKNKKDIESVVAKDEKVLSQYPFALLKNQMFFWLFKPGLSPYVYLSPKEKEMFFTQGKLLNQLSADNIHSIAFLFDTNSALYKGTLDGDEQDKFFAVANLLREGIVVDGKTTNVFTSYDHIESLAKQLKKSAPQKAKLLLEFLQIYKKKVHFAINKQILEDKPEDKKGSLGIMWDAFKAPMNISSTQASTDQIFSIKQYVYPVLNPKDFEMKLTETRARYKTVFDGSLKDVPVPEKLFYYYIWLQIRSDENTNLKDLEMQYELGPAFKKMLGDQSEYKHIFDALDKEFLTDNQKQLSEEGRLLHLTLLNYIISHYAKADPVNFENNRYIAFLEMLMGGSVDMRTGKRVGGEGFLFETETNSSDDNHKRFLERTTLHGNIHMMFDSRIDHQFFKEFDKKYAGIFEMPFELGTYIVGRQNQVAFKGIKLDKHHKPIKGTEYFIRDAETLKKFILEVLEGHKNRAWKTLSPDNPEPEDNDADILAKQALSQIFALFVTFTTSKNWNIGKLAVFLLGKSAANALPKGATVNYVLKKALSKNWSRGVVAELINKISAEKLVYQDEKLSPDELSKTLKSWLGRMTLLANIKAHELSGSSRDFAVNEFKLINMMFFYDDQHTDKIRLANDLQIQRMIKEKTDDYITEAFVNHAIERLKELKSEFQKPDSVFNSAYKELQARGFIPKGRYSAEAIEQKISRLNELKKYLKAWQADAKLKYMSSTIIAEQNLPGVKPEQKYLLKNALLDTQEFVGDYVHLFRSEVSRLMQQSSVTKDKLPFVKMQLVKDLYFLKNNPEIVSDFEDSNFKIRPLTQTISGDLNKESVSEHFDDVHDDLNPLQRILKRNFVYKAAGLEELRWGDVGISAVDAISSPVESWFIGQKQKIASIYKYRVDIPLGIASQFQNLSSDMTDLTILSARYLAMITKGVFSENDNEEMEWLVRMIGKRYDELKETTFQLFGSFGKYETIPAALAVEAIQLAQNGNMAAAAVLLKFSIGLMKNQARNVKYAGSLLFQRARDTGRLLFTHKAALMDPDTRMNRQRVGLVTRNILGALDLGFRTLNNQLIPKVINPAKEKIAEKAADLALFIVDKEAEFDDKTSKMEQLFLKAQKKYTRLTKVTKGIADTWDALSDQAQALANRTNAKGEPAFGASTAKLLRTVAKLPGEAFDLVSRMRHEDHLIEDWYQFGGKQKMIDAVNRMIPARIQTLRQDVGRFYRNLKGDISSRYNAVRMKLSTWIPQRSRPWLRGANVVGNPMHGMSNLNTGYMDLIDSGHKIRRAVDAAREKLKIPTQIKNWREYKDRQEYYFDTLENFIKAGADKGRLISELMASDQNKAEDTISKNAPLVINFESGRLASEALINRTHYRKYFKAEDTGAKKTEDVKQGVYFEQINQIEKFFQSAEHQNVAIKNFPGLRFNFSQLRVHSREGIRFVANLKDATLQMEIGELTLRKYRNQSAQFLLNEVKPAYEKFVDSNALFDLRPEKNPKSDSEIKKSAKKGVSYLPAAELQIATPEMASLETEYNKVHLNRLNHFSDRVHEATLQIQEGTLDINGVPIAKAHGLQNIDGELVNKILVNTKAQFDGISEPVALDDAHFDSIFNRKALVLYDKGSGPQWLEVDVDPESKGRAVIIDGKKVSFNELAKDPTTGDLAPRLRPVTLKIKGQAVRKVYLMESTRELYEFNVKSQNFSPISDVYGYKKDKHGQYEDKPAFEIESIGEEVQGVRKLGLARPGQNKVETGHIKDIYERHELKLLAIASEIHRRGTLMGKSQQNPKDPEYMASEIKLIGVDGKPLVIETDKGVLSSLKTGNRKITFGINDSVQFTDSGSQVEKLYDIKFDAKANAMTAKIKLRGSKEILEINLDAAVGPTYQVEENGIKKNVIDHEAWSRGIRGGMMARPTQRLAALGALSGFSIEQATGEGKGLSNYLIQFVNGKRFRGNLNLTADAELAYRDYVEFRESLSKGGIEVGFLDPNLKGDPDYVLKKRQVAARANVIYGVEQDCIFQIAKDAMAPTSKRVLIVINRGTYDEGDRLIDNKNNRSILSAGGESANTYGNVHDWKKTHEVFRKHILRDLRFEEIKLLTEASQAEEPADLAKAKSDFKTLYLAATQKSASDLSLAEKKLFAQIDAADNGEKFKMAKSQAIGLFESENKLKIMEIPRNTESKVVTGKAQMAVLNLNYLEELPASKRDQGKSYVLTTKGENIFRDEFKSDFLTRGQNAAKKNQNREIRVNALMTAYAKRLGIDYNILGNQAILMKEGVAQHNSRESYGIHMAYEAIHGLPVQTGSKSLIEVSQMEFWKMFRSLAITTGTIDDKMGEIRRTLGSLTNGVVEIPRHYQLLDLPLDENFKIENGKVTIPKSHHKVIEDAAKELVKMYDKTAEAQIKLQLPYDYLPKEGESTEKVYENRKAVRDAYAQAIQSALKDLKKESSYKGKAELIDNTLKAFSRKADQLKLIPLPHITVYKNVQDKFLDQFKRAGLLFNAESSKGGREKGAPQMTYVDPNEVIGKEFVYKNKEGKTVRVTPHNMTEFSKMASEIINQYAEGITVNEYTFEKFYKLPEQLEKAKRSNNYTILSQIGGRGTDWKFDRQFEEVGLTLWNTSIHPKQNEYWQVVGRDRRSGDTGGIPESFDLEGRIFSEYRQVLFSKIKTNKQYAAEAEINLSHQIVSQLAEKNMQLKAGAYDVTAAGVKGIKVKIDDDHYEIFTEKSGSKPLFTIPKESYGKLAELTRFQNKISAAESGYTIDTSEKHKEFERFRQNAWEAIAGKDELHRQKMDAEYNLLLSGQIDRLFNTDFGEMLGLNEFDKETAGLSNAEKLTRYAKKETALWLKAQLATEELKSYSAEDRADELSRRIKMAGEILKFKDLESVILYELRKQPAVAGQTEKNLFELSQSYPQEFNLALQKIADTRVALDADPDDFRQKISEKQSQLWSEYMDRYKDIASSAYQHEVQIEFDEKGKVITDKEEALAARETRLQKEVQTQYELFKKASVEMMIKDFFVGEKSWWLARNINDFTGLLREQMTLKEYQSLEVRNARKQSKTAQVLEKIEKETSEVSESKKSAKSGKSLGSMKKKIDKQGGFLDTSLFGITAKKMAETLSSPKVEIPLSKALMAQIGLETPILIDEKVLDHYLSQSNRKTKKALLKEIISQLTQSYRSQNIKMSPAQIKLKATAVHSALIKNKINQENLMSAQLESTTQLANELTSKLLEQKLETLTKEHGILNATHIEKAFTESSEASIGLYQQVNAVMAEEVRTYLFEKQKYELAPGEFQKEIWPKVKDRLGINAEGKLEIKKWQAFQYGTDPAVYEKMITDQFKDLEKTDPQIKIKSKQDYLEALKTADSAKKQSLISKLFNQLEAANQFVHDGGTVFVYDPAKNDGLSYEALSPEQRAHYSKTKFGATVKRVSNLGLATGKEALLGLVMGTAFGLYKGDKDLKSLVHHAVEEAKGFASFRAQTGLATMMGMGAGEANRFAMFWGASKAFNHTSRTEQMALVTNALTNYIAFEGVSLGLRAGLMERKYAQNFFQKNARTQKLGKGLGFVNLAVTMFLSQKLTSLIDEKIIKANPAIKKFMESAAGQNTAFTLKLSYDAYLARYLLTGKGFGITNLMLTGSSRLLRATGIKLAQKLAARLTIKVALRSVTGRVASKFLGPVGVALLVVDGGATIIDKAVNSNLDSFYKNDIFSARQASKGKTAYYTLESGRWLGLTGTAELIRQGIEGERFKDELVDRHDAMLFESRNVRNLVLDGIIKERHQFQKSDIKQIALGEKAADYYLDPYAMTEAELKKAADDFVANRKLLTGAFNFEKADQKIKEATDQAHGIYKKLEEQLNQGNKNKFFNTASIFKAGLNNLKKLNEQIASGKDITLTPEEKNYVFGAQDPDKHDARPDSINAKDNPALTRRLQMFRLKDYAAAMKVFYKQQKLSDEKIISLEEKYLKDEEGAIDTELIKFALAMRYDFLKKMIRDPNDASDKKYRSTGSNALFVRMMEMNADQLRANPVLFKKMLQEGVIDLYDSNSPLAAKDSKWTNVISKRRAYRLVQIKALKTEGKYDLKAPYAAIDRQAGFIDQKGHIVPTDRFIAQRLEQLKPQTNLALKSTDEASAGTKESYANFLYHSTASLISKKGDYVAKELSDMEKSAAIQAKHSQDKAVTDFMKDHFGKVKKDHRKMVLVKLRLAFDQAKTAQEKKFLKAVLLRLGDKHFEKKLAAYSQKDKEMIIKSINLFESLVTMPSSKSSRIKESSEKLLAFINNHY